MQHPNFCATTQVLAIESLHDLGIVHHDIKPENVLIDADGHCVIADYGSAKLLAPDGTLCLDINEDVLATLSYAAPELLSCDDCDENGLKYYDESVDWWALGALIIFMVIGRVCYFQLALYSLGTNYISSGVLRWPDHV